MAPHAPDRRREPLTDPAGDFGPPASTRSCDSLTKNHVLSRRSSALLIAVGVALLLLAGLLSTQDGWLAREIADLAPHASFQRFLLKQPYRLFATPMFVFIAALLLTQPRRRELLIGYGIALLAAAAPIHLLKFLVGRARPQLDLGSATFLPVTIHDGFDSFPSGHVAGAIIITFLLAIYVPRSQWFLAPLVAVVAVARIVQGRHFPSDVLAGGAIALLSLVFIVTWLGPRYFAPIDWAPIRQAFARRPNLAPQPD